MIACIRLPYFAAALTRLANPTLAAAPLILVDEADRVYAVCRLAAQAGIHHGMCRRQAEGLCLTAQFALATPVQDRYVLNTLCETLNTFVDHIEIAERPQFSDALLYLDMGHLDEADLAGLTDHMMTTVATRHHLLPAIGLAANKFTAYIVALSAPPGQIKPVLPGYEAAYLATFPAALLPVDHETMRRFDLLGLHTIGQIATLPVSALMNQFGMAGRGLHQLANGHDVRTVPHYQPQQWFSTTRQFEPVVDNRLLLETTLRDIAVELCAALEEHNLVAQELLLAITLDHRTNLSTGIVLREPTADSRHLNNTLTDLLIRMPVTAAVAEVIVTAVDCSPVMPRQLDLFADHAEAGNFADVIRMLVRRYGTDRVFYAVSANTESALVERRYRLVAA